MVVSLYQLTAEAWTFRPEPNTEPVRVRVPRGSELLEVKGLGLELFVPAIGDPLQRIAWNPRQVLAAAREGRRFKVLGPGKFARAAG